MRIGIAALFLAANSVLAAEQGQQQVANTECVQRLRLPAYPVIAVSARLAGDVSARITIGDGGAVRDVGFAGKPHPLLANSVRDAIRESTFVATCKYREVILEFKFVIEGKGTDYPAAPAISFGFPNTFWIVSAPRNIQP